MLTLRPRVLGLLCLLGPVACATAPLVLPLEAVVPAGTASFALDLVPAPAEDGLLPVVARLGDVRVEGGRDGEPALSVLHDLFVEVVGASREATVRLADLPGGAPESFTLFIRLEEGEVVAEIAGADEAGRHWGAQALRQLVMTHGGARWIRLGEIRDRPAFPLRGSKRPLAWEGRYRANLDYETSLADEAAARPHRVAVLSPGGVLDATEEGVKAAERFFREGYARGIRLFAVEFDDVPFGMTSETRDRFGTYPSAIAHYLRRCRGRLGAIDAEAILYWLPQTYWTDHPLFDRLARDVGLSGGLPEDLGLVLTGPRVVSPRIPTGSVARARRAYGLVAQKALIYDNRGRDGDHGPLEGRDPDLHREADAVFGERGEALNRITRLDYSWNPAGYDPVRSHLLACREVVGPAAAPHLSSLIRRAEALSSLEILHLFRETSRHLDRTWSGPVPAWEYLARIWRDLRHSRRPGTTGGSSPAQ